jgi:hypothetical protein
MSKIKVALTAIVMSAVLIGCNKQVVDLTYTYNYAIIQLPNGEIVEGEIQSWCDYEGEQLQVKIDDVIYLCSSYNCVLMNK